MKMRIILSWMVFLAGAVGFLPAALAVYALIWALTESALGWMQIPAGQLLGSLPVKKLVWKRMGWTALAGVGVMGLTQLAQVFFSYAFPSFVEWQLKMEQQIGGFDLIIAMMIGPFIEELAFRGAMLRGLSHWRGPRVALLWIASVSAFLFADLFGAPLFAVILGILVIETQSLWSSILVRLGLGVLYLVLMRLFPPSADFEALREGAWRAAFFLAVGFPGIYVMLRGWKRLPRSAKSTKRG